MGAGYWIGFSIGTVIALILSQVYVAVLPFGVALLLCFITGWALSYIGGAIGDSVGRSR